MHTYLLSNGVDFDKHGNAEKLRFPPFHNEILSQNWWNVSENLGRIKVVVSEGFFRGSRDPSFERVKNKVSFSFQHAPLGVYNPLLYSLATPQCSRANTG
jgi:hypothetical protein